MSILYNKKVLQRERKRHTARRVAIASLCYSGGGGRVPWQKIFSESEHVSSRIWCQKFFPVLGRGGGSLDKNFFSHSEHVSSQIWRQKFFPLLQGGGGPSTKIFFPSLNMYQAKSGVKNFSLYWGGGRGVSLYKKFFSGLNMYQAKSVVKNFSLYCGGGGGPSTKIFFPVWTCIKPNLVSKNFPFTETGYPPPDLDLGPPPDLRLGTPPGPGTPPPPEMWTDRQTENSTFPHPPDAGGKNVKFVLFTKTCCNIHHRSTRNMVMILLG